MGVLFFNSCKIIDSSDFATSASDLAISYAHNDAVNSISKFFSIFSIFFSDFLKKLNIFILLQALLQYHFYMHINNRVMKKLRNMLLRPKLNNDFEYIYQLIQA